MPHDNAMPVHPKAAASLVLLRGDPNEPEVLLGKRHPDLRFMPGYAVFPGGRVDANDKMAATELALQADNLTGIHDDLTAEDWLAHSLAACRECLEETGYFLTGHHPVAHILTEPDQFPLEEHFYLQQALEQKMNLASLPLPCLAQAITPESSPIRFNARFFLADGSHVTLCTKPEGELQFVGWYKVSDVLSDFPLADVSEFVLREALSCFKSGKLADIPPLLTYDDETERVIITRG